MSRRRRNNDRLPSGTKIDHHPREGGGRRRREGGGRRRRAAEASDDDQGSQGSRRRRSRSRERNRVHRVRRRRRSPSPPTRLKRLLRDPDTLTARSMQTLQMSQSGASLQNYNTELVKCLQDLKTKRDAVHKEMANEEREKSRVQKQLAELFEQLHRLNESISQKQQAKNEYDKTIQETEAAYVKSIINIMRNIEDC